MTDNLVESVGFPNFWQGVFDENRAAFEAIERLIDMQATFFAPAVNDNLSIIVRHHALVAINSLRAVLILCVNGCGFDAFRIARSMWEAELVTHYLEVQPSEVDDYLEWHHVNAKRQSDYIRAARPDLFAAVEPTRKAEIESEYKRVAPRFTKNGKLRKSWTTVTIADMARELGNSEQYLTFYGMASSVHHGDASGLQMQTDLSGEVILVPSKVFVTTSLMSAHRAAVAILTLLSKVANLGADAQTDQLTNEWKAAWLPVINARDQA